MKSRTLILALWLGSSAWAQTAPQKPAQQPPAPAKPNAAAPAKPAAAATQKPVTPAPAPQAAKAPAPPAAKAPVSVAPKPAPAQPPKPAAAAAKPVAPAPAKPAPVVAKPATPAPAQKPAPAVAAKPAPSAKPSAIKHKGHKAPEQQIYKPESAPRKSTAAVVIKGQRDPFVSPIVERMGNATACTGSGRKCLAVGDVVLHGIVRSGSGFIAVVMNGPHTYFLHESDPLANGAVERITRDTIVMRERSSDAFGRPFTREVTKKLGVPAV